LGCAEKGRLKLAFLFFAGVVLWGACSLSVRLQ
jgi:hypothetical protein